MSDMIPLPDFPSLGVATFVVAIAAFLAGLSRGFSGFGGAPTLVPPLAAFYGPTVAAPAFLLCDLFVSMPLVPNAARKCAWSDLRFIVVGAVFGVPIGVTLLVSTDPTNIRWVVSIFVLASLLVLASGWRYSGRTAPVLTLGVGAASGTLSGMATIGGPPVIVYLLGGPRPVEQIRATIYVYFAILTVLVMSLFIYRGLYTREVVGLCLFLAPTYALGIFLGSRMFSLASPFVFRLIAYVLVAVSAITSLPVLDSVLRPAG